jgi:replicative DNA helicase
MEKTILSHLIYNEKYGRKVLPFIKSEYFQSDTDKTVFDLIHSYATKYNQFPTKEAMFIDLENQTSLNEQTFKDVRQIVSDLKIDETTNLDWLVDKTEEFCQEKALFNALRESIKVMDKNSKVQKGSIPKLLQDALQVSFDSHVGHDFVEDASDRYDEYHKKEIKLDFDIEYLNKITGGGVPQKTLCCLIATTGGGKSLAMCHMASHNLMCNKNVLYITLEMAEERIAQRIDANLLDVTIQGLMELSKIEYQKKMEKIKKTTKGKLIIKEYPTASAGSAHFRHLLNELKIKRNFVPDVIYIDYLNLCISSRIKQGSQVNTYSYVKAVAEELRGLAVEFKVPIWTATQANRGAFNASDVGLENTSDSIGLPMTVDLMLALIATEELDELGQIMIKQLKNRFGDPNINKRFVVGIDRAKMRLYNVEQSAQEEILDGPVFDDSKFGEEEDERKKPKKKFNKDKFKGFL